MLTSSREYLQALREGKFLLFLEWPQFIAQHYSNDKDMIDADETLNLIIFEWLNNGFCDNDVKQMALLTKVHDLEAMPIRAGLSYAFISLSIAMYHCMIFDAAKVQSHFLTQEPLTGKQACDFTRKQSVLLDKTVFVELEIKTRDSFLTLLDTVDNKLVTQAFARIYSITKFRYLIDQYITELECTRNPLDQLLNARISLVKSLANFLNEQSEYTDKVKEEMGVYVKQIWEMQPLDFEGDYLNCIYPLSIVDNAWKLVTDYGLKFFSMLQGPPALAITNETKDTDKLTSTRKHS